MKRNLFAAAAATLAFALLPAHAGAEQVLGKVETVYVAMSQFVLVEYTPGMRTHDRPFVADVRLRDANGQAARRVMLRLDQEKVDAGDIIAIIEGDQGRGMRTAPLLSRDRFSRIEAKHDSLQARGFFNETAKFAALRKE